MALHPLDLTVLVAYLAGVAWIGIALGRGTQDVSSYLLGDRHLPWWAILGSIVATETSTATFLSVPAIAFADQGDMRFLQLTMGYILGRLIIVVTLLPLFFRGRIFTAYEVLQVRFGSWTKGIASCIFLVTRNLGDGLRLFITAVALEQVISIPLPWCVALIGIVTIFYTLVGGMKAVVWNDCFQFAIYVLGGIVALAVIVHRLPGGSERLIEYARSHHKFDCLDWRFSWSDPYAFWTAFLGGMFLTLGTHGTDQMMVQRYLSAGSLREASRALGASGFVVAVQTAFFLLIGIALAAFYHEYPRSEPFSSNDRVFATFIVQEFPVGKGLIGLVLAAVFAAAMSTLSSSINSSAGSALKDLYLPLTGNTHLSESGQLLISRWLTVLFGMIQIGVGIAAQGMKKTVVENALTIASFSAGLLLGVFALGMLTRRVGQTATSLGLIVGLTTLAYAAFVSGWGLAWPWFALLGSLITFVASLTFQFAHSIWLGDKS